VVSDGVEESLLRTGAAGLPANRDASGRDRLGGFRDRGEDLGKELTRYLFVVARTQCGNGQQQ
jgi:hypothetical protein